MLSSIRKFSTSWYAKILLGIIVIPFVFWGMGGVFTSGNKNVIVVIDKNKFSTQEFADFVRSQQTANEKINSERIDQFLSTFIGSKLIVKRKINFLSFKLIFTLKLDVTKRSRIKTGTNISDCFIKKIKGYIR